VGGKTSGLLELGDIVTFEAVHLGVRQRLTSRIVEFDRPTRFVDEMVSGAFASLRHEHAFYAEADSVLMRDTLDWRSPFGVLGAVADRLVVERHMRRFMIHKQAELKAYAERVAKDAAKALHSPSTAGLSTVA
jgi:ligand-binding SRPBCC domain-containing protein